MLPIAYHDGSVLLINSRAIPIQSLENLIVFQAPAGRQQISIRFHKPPIYQLGLGGSIFSALILIFYLARQGGVPRVQDPGEKTYGK